MGNVFKLDLGLGYNEVCNNLRRLNVATTAPTNPGTQASADLCLETAKIILDRGKTHGDAFDNLQDIADRWTFRLRAKGYAGPELTIADVCYFMAEMKLSRSACGNPDEPDHLVDILGYGAIGAAWLKQ